MSFDSDSNEIKMLMHLTEASMQEHFKIIREILERMNKAYQQNIQTISEDDNGTRPENWRHTE